MVVLKYFNSLALTTLLAFVSQVSARGIWDISELSTDTLRAEALSQRAQQPDLNAFDLSGLPLATFTQKNLDTLPDKCAANTGADKECKSGMTATEVRYDDCGDTWKICHCNDNKVYSLDDAVKGLAQVPIGLRRHVGVVMIMPGDSTSAYTYLGDGEMHIFHKPDTRLWVHEVRTCLGILS